MEVDLGDHDVADRRALGLNEGGTRGGWGRRPSLRIGAVAGEVGALQRMTSSIGQLRPRITVRVENGVERLPQRIRHTEFVGLVRQRSREGPPPDHEKSVRRQNGRLLDAVLDAVDAPTLQLDLGSPEIDQFHEFVVLAISRCVVVDLGDTNVHDRRSRCGRRFDGRAATVVHVRTLRRTGDDRRHRHRQPHGQREWACRRVTQEKHPVTLEVATTIYTLSGPGVNMGNLDTGELIRDLALNLVSIFLLVYVIYFRRHRRWDQVVGYVAFNISLFTVSAALGSSGPLNVGVGFGLFAVLSVVRLRSDESGQIEIGFTMVALVLGLMTGLPGMEFGIKVLFAALLVVTASSTTRRR